MTSHTTHRPHTFIANMLGSFGHVATLFVWLLVLDLVVILVSLSGAVADISASIGLPAAVSNDTAVSQATSVSHAPLQFLLTVLLLVLTWIFGYFLARASSRGLRHLLVLFGRRPSLPLLVTAKYLAIATGLIGVVVLLQFVPPVQAAVKLPIAFLALLSGCIGVGSIWAQRIIAERYHAKIDQIL